MKSGKKLHLLAGVSGRKPGEKQKIENCLKHALELNVGTENFLFKHQTAFY